MTTHSSTGTRLRGVNLGGWLVLEKWMRPSLFAGLEATDETRWCVELGDRAPARLRAHWQRFITRDDFAWLAETGINAVRIPFGHWLLGPPYPYHPAYAGLAHPFVEGGVEVLDAALDWADEFGLRVVLDLHAAPGCQNGFDNGGLLGICDWSQQPEYIDFSVQLLGRIAQRYRAEPALHAIEVLNEPRWDVPTPLLYDYYRRAYIRFVMDHRIFRIPVLSFVFRTGKAIPIAPAREDAALLERANDEVARALEQGELVGIFPEGRITEDGEIGRFRTGIERIVGRTPVPVVPMALKGLYGSFFSRRGGAAMTRPFRRGVFSRIGLEVAPALAPAQATPEVLKARIQAMRGDWR